MPATRVRSNPKIGNDNRRGELVRAAAQLFREKGFEGTTIRDIAGAVGMQSGSPFYHFANKHELLMAVMEEGLRLGLERTRAAVVEAEPLRTDERALLDRLRAEDGPEGVVEEVRRAVVPARRAPPS